MPNMYSKIIIHATFSTGYRKKWISPAMEPELYNYLGGTLNGLECQSIIVNGFLDHVHLLFHCPARLAVSDVIREVKKASTSWVQDRYALPIFHWQAGGGAFSVDHHAIERMVRYISNQHEHHKTKGIGFEDEYRELLRENRVPFDERYLLDPPKEEV